MAVGALKALQEAGLQVPRDTAVVSFNGIDEAEYASTPLSTVKVYTEEMGRTGVKLLLDRLNGRTVPLAVTLPTSLIVRQARLTRKEVTCPALFISYLKEEKMKRLLALFLSFTCMILQALGRTERRRRKAENIDSLFHHILRQRTRRIQKVG